jgi:hypothetical protein
LLPDLQFYSFFLVFFVRGVASFLPGLLLPDLLFCSFTGFAGILDGYGGQGLRLRKAKVSRAPVGIRGAIP